MNSSPLSQSNPTQQLALAPEQLRRRLDPTQFSFQTTAEVAPLQDTIGQPRAMDAIAFGLEIGSNGYNLFVAGAPGSGRESTVRTYLEQLAPSRPTPDDWVYIFNFAEPDRPKALRLPVGQGVALAQAMDEFVTSAQRQITRVFEGEEYARRQRETLADINQQREALLERLQKFAAERDFKVQATRVGIVAVPLVKGEPISDEAFKQLTPQQQLELQQRGAEVQEAINDAMRQAHELDKQATERVRQLDRDVTFYTIGSLFSDLRERYKENAEVLQYLNQVQNDVPDHLADFLPDGARGGETPAPLAQFQAMEREARLARYRVNLLVDNRQHHGAPIIIERNPTYYNLVGRIDYRAAFGAMLTDFREVKAGALQRANGGFLVLHVLDLLNTPFAWDALKRALISREVRIENLGEQYSFFPTATLRPEPIPLTAKVVLIGPPILYHLMYQLDEDFRELFKVKADFAPDMPWDEDHVHNYAAFLSRCVRDTGLKHFDRGAVAQVVEYGARQCEDQRKLSTRLLEIANIATEASFWASKMGHEFVQADDVGRAIAKKEYRSNLIEERIHELINDGTIMIDTTGSKPAQINGISIRQLGDYHFGQPTRITARVALGKGTVQSIEREIKLSGPIHAKGFLILSSYLSAQYAQEWPLAVGATLTFEQSYDEVEGDSASSTELYVLLSALAGLPLKQSIAVTGSVNQHGEVQAVGGVTRKIEGFFAVCKAKGLTGEQGVIIPAANIPHLMLSDEVVEAVRVGKFHVWAVRTIDEGLHLLTGCPAGARSADGAYPEGCVHRLVEERLRRYAEQMRTFSAGPGKGES